MFEALITNLFPLAQAAAKPAAGQQSVMTIVMLGAFVAIFYFMILRPQQKQRKEHQSMIDSLRVGDKIITTSGIYGQITDIRKTSVRVRVAQGVELRMLRSAITNKTSKDPEREEVEEIAANAQDSGKKK